jgi:peptidyl-prolyl cis-trans isomerase SurA
MRTIQITTRILSLTLLLALFAPFAVLFPPAVSRGEIVDRIVAVVNDDIITLSELNERMRPYVTRVRAMGYTAAQEQQMLFKIREDILKQIIEQRLTDQQVKKDGITVGDAEVDAAIERIKQAQTLTDEELRKNLAAEGVTLNEYRRKMKEQLLRTRVLDYEVKSKIVVTEEDIKAYYDSHPAEFGGDRFYHLRNIILRLPEFAGEKKRKAVRDRMEAISAELAAGASFAEMARRYSESSLAADGGYLGRFKLKDLAPKIAAAVKETPAGGYTPVIDTDQGFQILYVERIEDVPPKSLKSVSKEIEEKLYKKMLDDKFNDWLEELRSRSHIKIVR